MKLKHALLVIDGLAPGGRGGRVLNKVLNGDPRTPLYTFFFIYINGTSFI